MRYRIITVSLPDLDLVETRARLRRREQAARVGGAP